MFVLFRKSAKTETVGHILLNIQLFSDSSDCKCNYLLGKTPINLSNFKKSKQNVTENHFE